jgi:hypothetical protein
MAEVHMIVLGHDAILKKDDPALSAEGLQVIKTATLGLEDYKHRVAYPRVLAQRVNAHKFADRLNIFDALEVPGLKTWPTLSCEVDPLVSGIASRIENAYQLAERAPTDSEVLLTFGNRLLVDNLLQYSGGLALTTTVNRVDGPVNYTIQPVPPVL